MTKKFSLILPTHERPRLIKNLLKSIVQTTARKEELEIILCLDEGDRQIEEICKPLLAVTTVRINKASMGDITRRCFEKSQGRFVMLLNDDMIFRTQDWDIKILAALSKFPDGIALVYGDDLYYGKKMCTFPILPRITCELMDKICPEEYRRHCIDPHIFDIFQRLSLLGHERRVYLPEVIFEHIQLNLGVLLNDPPLQISNDEDDQRVYFKFGASRQQIAQRMAEHIHAQ